MLGIKGINSGLGARILQGRSFSVSVEALEQSTRRHVHTFARARASGALHFPHGKATVGASRSNGPDFVARLGEKVGFSDVDLHGSFSDQFKRAEVCLATT